MHTALLLLVRVRVQVRLRALRRPPPSPLPSGVHFRASMRAMIRTPVQSSLHDDRNGKYADEYERRVPSTPSSYIPQASPTGGELDGCIRTFKTSETLSLFRSIMRICTSLCSNAKLPLLGEVARNLFRQFFGVRVHSGTRTIGRVEGIVMGIHLTYMHMTDSDDRDGLELVKVVVQGNLRLHGPLSRLRR